MKRSAEIPVVDKTKVLEWLREWREDNDIPDIPGATAEMARQAIQAEGVRSESDELSRSILQKQ